MRLVLALILMGFLAPGAAAQAPRQVFLSLCNDAPFAAGVAATYPVDPSGRRMSRGWFRVEANSCLEGAIDGVVGRSMALHVRSGEWRWPEGEGDAQWCAPSESYSQPSDLPPCDSGQEPAGYATVSVRDFHPGWGRVDYRFGCEAFGDDAALCAASPTGRDGLAEPVRTLEVCNWSGETMRLATAAPGGDSTLIVRGWTALESPGCRDVFRGFPAENRVYVHARTEDGAPVRGLFHMLCVSEDAFEIALPLIVLTAAPGCHADGQQEAHFREMQFRNGVSRLTFDIGAMPER